MQSLRHQLGIEGSRVEPRLDKRMRPRRAFTIIELVIVLLILGIVSAVAMPTFYDSLLFHRVESAARRVKADLELARSQARLTSTNQSITFANSSYTISNTKSLDNANHLYTVDLTQQPYSLDSATANFSNTATASFDGYGAPASGGTVVLMSKSHQCTITLDGATGEATITSSHPRGGTAQTPSMAN